LSWLSPTVEAEPDDDKPAPPLPLERRCVWPTAGTRLEPFSEGLGSVAFVSASC